jgi:NAD(P)-dependent dehydrogenase (short-subunit alcohol dehydrogenase family)
MIDLKNKVVLITGAGKGLGRQAAIALAGRGAIVAADDVTPINLDETVRLIQAGGGQVRAYVEDIAKKMPVQGLLTQVLDDFGRIDLLINCARVQPCKLVLEMDEWDWQRTLDVNLTASFLLTQSVGRIMKEQKGGIIILVDRQSDLAAEPESGYAATHASQAGLVAFARSAAHELSGQGVCLCIARTLEDILEACTS